MAITLQLTEGDGLQTVDFNDGTSLRLGNAFQQNTGGGSVTELVICGWVDSVTTDQKAAKMRDIHQLIRKGVRHFRNRHIDRAVWLKWQPENATSAQYAKVMGGGVVEVGSNVVGGRAGGVLQVEIVREGFWRSVAPDGTAGTSVISAETVYNKVDADGNNWLEISARDIDAPALVKFTIDPAQQYRRVLIARRHGPFEDLPGEFIPHLNAEDNDSGSTTTTASAAPGDDAVVISLTDDTESVWWDISSSAAALYKGRYGVYAWVKQISGAGSATALFAVKTGTGQISDSKTVSSSIGKLYFGSFEIYSNFNPDVVAATALRLALDVTITGTAVVHVYGLWLVPLEFPPFQVSADASNDFAVTATDELIVDGYNQITYESTSIGEWKATTQLETQGVYQVIEPNTETRIYFYFEDGGEHEFNDSYTVDMEVIDRFETLRGGA